MAFDRSTAKPVRGKFDISTARPLGQSESGGLLPTIQDVLRSGGEYLGNTAQALLHPIQTAQGIGNLAVGGVQKLIPGTQPQEVYADALGDFLKQRYGSFDAVKETLKRDPVGMMADASMFMTGGAGAVTKIGEISAIPKIVSAGRLASRAGRLADPLVVTSKAAQFAGRIPSRVMESSMKGTAAKAINSLIKPTNRQFSYGRNPGLAVAQEGIVASSLEDLVQKTAASRDALGQQIGTALTIPAVAQKRLNVARAIDPITTAITKARQNPRTNAAVIQRLENLRDDLLGVIVNPDGTTTATRNVTAISPLDAFNLKKTIGELTKWTDNLSDDSVINAALKQTYSEVRKTIEQAVPGIKPLNERYSNLLEASNAARNQALAIQRRSQFGITDILAGTIGGIHGGLPTAVVGVLLSQGAKAAIQSPYVRTNLANWMAHATPTEVEAFFNRVPGLKGEIARLGVLAGTGQQRLDMPQ